MKSPAGSNLPLQPDSAALRLTALGLLHQGLNECEEGRYKDLRITITQLQSLFPDTVGFGERNIKLDIPGFVNIALRCDLDRVQHELDVKRLPLDREAIHRALRSAIDCLQVVEREASRPADGFSFDALNLPTSSYIIQSCDTKDRTLSVIGNSARHDDKVGILTIISTPRESAVVERREVSLPSACCAGEFSENGRLLILYSNYGWGHEKTGVWAVRIMDDDFDKLLEVPKVEKLSVRPLHSMALSPSGTRAALIQPATPCGRKSELTGENEYNCEVNEFFLPHSTRDYSCWSRGSYTSDSLPELIYQGERLMAQPLIQLIEL